MESYWETTLCRAYKFNYKDNLLLVLKYNRFSYRGTYYNTEGTLCFTKDGRRVKFNDTKDSFEKEPDQILFEVTFGYASNEAGTYVVLYYDYFDKSNFENGIISVQNAYTTDGKKIEMSESLKTENLCTQKITEL